MITTQEACPAETRVYSFSSSSEIYEGQPLSVLVYTLPSSVLNLFNRLRKLEEDLGQEAFDTKEYRDVLYEFGTRATTEKRPVPDHAEIVITLVRGAGSVKAGVKVRQVAGRLKSETPQEKLRRKVL